MSLVLDLTVDIVLAMMHAARRYVADITLIKTHAAYRAGIDRAKKGADLMSALSLSSASLRITLPSR